jgi:hypothetical protein
MKRKPWTELKADLVPGLVGSDYLAAWDDHKRGSDVLAEIRKLFLALALLVTLL